MKTRFIAFLLLLAVNGLAEEPRNPAVIASAFINEHAPYAECHASTIAKVAPGKLVAAWFGGTREGAPDIGIWVARQEERHWLDAVEVANGLQPDGTRLPTWNPVLFQPKSGPLVLFYKIGPSPSAWWGMMMTSADGGKSWSKPARLPTGVLGPIKNKPVLLADGAWLCPSSTEGDKAGWQVHFEITRDSGRTWEIIGPVEKGNKLDAIQPSVLFHSNGRLQALCRTRNGVIATTWSSDGGKKWSPLASAGLPNPNSGIDAVTLADGRQLLVYNHSAPPPDRPTKGARYPLDVAISSDGVKWQHVLTLEDQPSDNGYAYPAVIQTFDGLVHITYTWNRQHIKYVVLDPKQLGLGGDGHFTTGETSQAGKTFVGTILVVLGNEPLDNHTPTVDMIARVKKAVEFHKANPDSLMVLTGGTTVGEVSEARMMAEIAITSGVSTNSMRLEESARSTSENASLTAKIVGTFNPSHILIVSKADHLDWAMPIFRKYDVFTNAEPMACTIDDKDSIAQMREYLVTHPENNRVRERFRQLLK